MARLWHDFGTANHGLRGVKAGFWINRAKIPDAYFSFGTVSLARLCMNKYAHGARISKEYEEFKSWLRDGKKTHTKALRHEEFGMIIKHEFPRINHK